MTNEERQTQMIELNQRLEELHMLIHDIMDNSDDQQLNHELLKIAIDVTQTKMKHCDVYFMAGVYDEQ